MNSIKVTKELYNGEVKIDFYPGSHRYKLQGEKNYLLSVTTCTGVIDKSRVLINWALGLANTHLKQFLEDRQGQHFTSDELLPVVEEAIKLHTIKKEEAASIGTQTHDYAEKFGKAILAGENLPDIDPNLDERVVNGINAFLQWFNTHNVQFLDAERMLYSKQNEYVGFTDAIAVLDGKKTIIDYKTSKGIYSDYNYQLAAYWAAYEEETGDKLDQALIAHFDKETGDFATKVITREELDCHLNPSDAAKDT